MVCVYVCVCVSMRVYMCVCIYMCVYVVHAKWGGSIFLTYGRTMQYQKQTVTSKFQYIHYFKGEGHSIPPNVVWSA